MRATTGDVHDEVSASCDRQPKGGYRYFVNTNTMHFLHFKRSSSVVLIVLMASACSASPRSERPVAANPETKTSRIASSAPMDVGTPASWSTYTNDEDNYSISYPDSTDVTISHGRYKTGDTLIEWPGSSEVSVDIQVLDASIQNLTAEQLIARDEQSEVPTFTLQPLALDHMRGVLVFDKDGGNIEAEMYSTNHPDINLVFLIDFESSKADYPGFWQQMLNTFRLSSTGLSNCSGLACAAWH